MGAKTRGAIGILFLLGLAQCEQTPNTPAPQPPAPVPALTGRWAGATYFYGPPSGVWPLVLNLAMVDSTVTGTVEDPPDSRPLVPTRWRGDSLDLVLPNDLGGALILRGVQSADTLHGLCYGLRVMKKSDWSPGGTWNLVKQ